MIFFLVLFSCLKLSSSQLGRLCYATKDMSDKEKLYEFDQTKLENVVCKDGACRYQEFFDQGIITIDLLKAE